MRRGIYPLCTKGVRANVTNRRSKIRQLRDFIVVAVPLGQALKQWPDLVFLACDDTDA